MHCHAETFPKVGTSFPVFHDLRIRWGLALLFCFTLLSAPAAGRTTVSPHLLSSSLRLVQNHADEILLEWNVGDYDSESAQSVLLFAHGPVSSVSTVILGFYWKAIRQGQTLAEGDEKNLPQEYESRQPTLSLRETGTLAGCRVALFQLIFAKPNFTINNENLSILLPRGTLRIRFPQPDPDSFQGLPKDFEPLAQALVLNYPPLRQKPFPDEPIPDTPWLQRPSVKISSQNSGILMLPMDSILSSLRESQPVLVKQTALFQNRRAIPFLLLDQQNHPKTQGMIVPSDRLVFYSPRSDSAFSPVTVTWFTLSQADHHNPSPLPSDGSQPRRRDLERRQILEEDLQFRNDQERNEKQSQFWVWHDFSKGSITIPLSIPPEIQSATVELAAAFQTSYFTVQNASVPLQIHLNQVPLQTIYQQRTPDSFTLASSIPAGMLPPGTHSLEIIPTDLSQDSSSRTIFLDRLQFDYSCTPFPSSDPFYHRGPEEKIALPESVQLVWAVQEGDPRQDAFFLVEKNNRSPVLPAGKDWQIYLLPAEAPIRAVTVEPVLSLSERSIQLDNPTQADLLIIAPRAWLFDLQSYEPAWRNAGYSTRRIAVEDLEDLFGDGRLSPFAIRRFIRFACAHWDTPSPSYLLLVGDATWDYWGRYHNGIHNFVPAYEARGDYPVDNWYARCDDPDDLLPDLIVSRIPVRESSELRAVLDKSFAFRSHPPLGDWTNRFFALTDNEFEAYTEETIHDGLPEGFQLIQRHVADYPLIDNIYLPARLRATQRAKTSLAATSDIIHILNDGVFYWQFFGHGAPNVMGKERLFFGGGSKFSDVRRLVQNSQPFILWSFSCETTRFDYPGEKWNISIGEDLLTYPQGGALAVLGASGRGYPQDHLALARGMHEAAFHYQLPTLGMQYFAAEMLGLAFKPNFEPIEQYTILGDPTLPLPRWIALTGSLTQTNSGWRCQWTIPPELQEAREASLWMESQKTIQALPPGSLAPGMDTLVNTIPASDIHPDSTTTLGVHILVKSSPRLVIGHGVLDIPPREPASPEILPTTRHLPDLVFDPPALEFEPASPRSGETIFLHATVRNAGSATAKNVFVQGYSAHPDQGGAPLDVEVGHEGAEINRLNPGESQHVRMRWDPVHNAGPHDLFLRIDPAKNIPESDESNNLLHAPLYVRRKADLVIDATHVQVQSIDSGSKLQVSFETTNLGESPAERVQIHFVVMRGDGKISTLILPQNDSRTASIAPNDSYSARRIGLPGDIQYFEIQVDPDEIVDEETHDNNLFHFVPGKDTLPGVSSSETVK